MDVTMTHAADDQYSHSEAELAIICDLAMWHQMPHLSARQIIQLNCGRWPVWTPSNINRIAEARRQDDSRDWYFPVLTERWVPKPGEIVPPQSCWAWSGVWHESAHQASFERALPLPAMSYLRKDWRYAGFSLCRMLASAGGLVLLQNTSDVTPIRRSPRLNKPVADPHLPDTSAPDWHTADKSMCGENVPPYWSRLLVCNPLTREFRELPAATCTEMGWQTWQQAYHHGVHIRMVADEEANSYQLIILLKNFVAVYKSTTNSWNCLRFPLNRPWGRGFKPRAYFSSTARLGGRLYFADIRSAFNLHNANALLAALLLASIATPVPVAAIRVFEVDAEAGKWHFRQQYILRKFHLPSLNPCPDTFPFDTNVIDNVELVECMGDLYAIVPARLHEVVTVGEDQTQHWKDEVHSAVTEGLKPKKPPGFHRQEQEVEGEEEDEGEDEGGMEEGEPKYMPLVFYVMQLREFDGEDHAVLRIEAPETRNPLELGSPPHMRSREQSMYRRTGPDQSAGFSWFNCEARGSVIWVSVEDYLLSYDVVSRKSTSQIIPAASTSGGAEWGVRLAYRPSFHMTP